MHSNPEIQNYLSDPTKSKAFCFQQTPIINFLTVLFVNRGTTVFLKVQLFIIFFVSRLLKYDLKYVPVCQIFLSYPKSCSF